MLARRARALAGGLGRRVAPDHAASGASTSGRAPPSSRPTCSRWPSATSARLADGVARRRLRRAALRHAVELRRRLGREDEGDPDHDGRVGAGERLLGRRRARPADRRAERARARHRRHDREVLADRGRAREDHLRLLDRAQPPLGRLPDHGAGRRPRRDRQRRRQHRLGRRLRQAARRAAVGRRACPGPAAYGRGGTEATTTDANLALGRINPRLLLRRRDRGRHGRGRPRARRGRRRSSASTAPRRRAASCGSRTTT